MYIVVSALDNGHNVINHYRVDRLVSSCEIV